MVALNSRTVGISPPVSLGALWRDEKWKRANQAKTAELSQEGQEAGWGGGSGWCCSERAAEMGPHGTWDVGGRQRAVGALNGEREGRGTHSVALRGQGGGGMRSEMEYS